MKKSHLFCLLLAISFTLSSCDGCEPDPKPSDKDRLCIFLGSGVWPSDYYPTSSVFFSPHPSDIESIDISVSQVQYINSNPYPVGGSGTLNYDLNYLNHNGWCIDVWKDREYIVNITMVQICGLDCNSDIWQQTSTGDIHVSCFEPGDIKWGKSQWSFYKHVTVFPVSTLTVNPTFEKCLDCGCQ
jgi:hypothetical protein